VSNELVEWIRTAVAGVAQARAMAARSTRDITPVPGDQGRLEPRPGGTPNSIVILCDVSESMNLMAGGKRRIEHLREALLAVVPTVPSAQLIAFGSIPTTIPGPEYLINPSGGTALHLALEAAAAYRPSRTVVISDGRPDNEWKALAAANLLTGLIDVIYCGPASDHRAIEFMERLARSAGGRVIVRDLRALSEPGREFASALRSLVGPVGPDR
jgi:hypothetical protein